MLRIILHGSGGAPVANTKRVYTYTPEQLERRAELRRHRYHTRPEVKQKAIVASKRWDENNPERKELNHERWREENRERLNTQARERHDPPRFRERNLINKYGLSQTAWDAMFAGQGFACAVCGTEEHGGRNWATDHDHKTGKVRGILCRACNLALGMADDNPSTLDLMARYLRHHA